MNRPPIVKSGEVIHLAPKFSSVLINYMANKCNKLIRREELTYYTFSVPDINRFFASLQELAALDVALLLIDL